MELPVYYKGQRIAWTRVDPEDYERFKGVRWGLYDHGTGQRAMGTIDGKQRELSAFILDVPKSFLADHANHDTLDNRRANLRVADKHRNAWNMKKTCSITTSCFKGVVYFPHDKRVRRWRAYINKNGKQNHLGYFATEQEAAKAYDKAARERFGDFACLNAVPGIGG